MSNSDSSTAGSKKQLDDIAEAVRKLQEELESDGKGRDRVLALVVDTKKCLKPDKEVVRPLLAVSTLTATNQSIL